MPTQRYSVTQPHIETLFSWIKSGEIAIPEIQRPFVWDATKVRNLLDSLSKGFPVGYLISWKNPDVKLKDGTSSSGKRILIDGQQRITALMASLLGREVVNKDYQTVRIKIAFHPVENRFEVYNPAIEKDSSWISDVSTIFDPNASIFNIVSKYCDNNPGVDRDSLFKSLETLKSITSNQIGLIELSHELDIETVTEIFIRVNSAGVPLSQADFAMSKIAVNETQGGNMMRKAIDYFCHLSVAPDFYSIVKKDKNFVESDYFNKLAWLKDENDGTYDPSYTDMLRVAFTSEFKRGKLEDLVALLSGRNFDTKQYEEAIVEDSFSRLKSSLLRFMNENDFKQYVMIVKSAGFVHESMITSYNVIDFGYILYHTLKMQKIPAADIQRYVRKWLALSILTTRYSGSPESSFDYDIKQINAQGIEPYMNGILKGELSDAYWESSLPLELNTSAGSSPYFNLYLAAQVKANDKGFLSSDYSVKELIEIKSDVHHLFPKDYLKKNGLQRGLYNQIGNYVVAQSEINIAISNKEPKVYFAQILEQCQGGKKKYGSIVDLDELKENLKAHCIPEGMEKMTIDDYDDFLIERRKLMARKIKQYFNKL